MSARDMFRLDTSVKTQTDLFAKLNRKPTFKDIIDDYIKLEKLENSN